MRLLTLFLFLYSVKLNASTFPNWVPDAQYLLQQNLINSSAYFRQLFHSSVEIPSGENCLKLNTEFRNQQFPFEFCLFSESSGKVIEEMVQLQFRGNIIFSLSLRRTGENLKKWNIEDAKLLRLPHHDKAESYELVLDPMGLRVYLTRKNDRIDVKYRYPFEFFNLYFSEYKKGSSQFRYYSITCRRCDGNSNASVESRLSTYAGIQYEYIYTMNSFPGQVTPQVVSTFFGQAVSGAVQLVSNDIVSKLKLVGLPSF